MELIIQFEKPHGPLHPFSQEILKESFDKARAKGGRWNIRMTQRQYTPGRYKYLFDCVYGLALPYVSHRFQIVRGGIPRSIETVEELHLCMKMLYCRVEMVDSETGETYSIPATTTELEDQEFYQVFEEQVIADLTERGAYGETGCPCREEWAELKKANQFIKPKLVEE